MALWTDVISPATLTVFSREIAERYDTDGLLADVFPSVQSPDVVFKWNQNDKSAQVAKARAYNAESAIGRGTGAKARLAELPPVSLKLEISEYEQVRRQSPNSDENVQAAAERKAAEATQAVVNRLALWRGEALTTGQLEIDENGVKQTVDFGRDASLTTTAATLWSASGADPLADIATWYEAVATTSGVAPDRVIVSRRVAAALVNAVKSSLTNPPAVFTRGNVNEILESEGLPTLTVNDRKVAGQRLFPDNVVLLASTEGAGATPYGPTAEALDPKYGVASLDPAGIYVGAYEEDDPATKWVRATANSMPVLGNPDMTLAATVLS